MPTSPVTRNLRDGELVIKDGSTPPQVLTVLLDEGDLSWTHKQKTIEVKDRGSITTGHTRPGDDEATELSFSAKWTQLIGKSHNSADPLTLYEALMFQTGASLLSTSQPGEQNTLTLEFTVTDPAGLANDKIVFTKVYRESLTMSEGEKTNLIAFSGRSFSTGPIVTRG